MAKPVASQTEGLRANCSTPCAHHAAKKQKCRSSHAAIVPFIAATASSRSPAASVAAAPAGPRVADLAVPAAALAEVVALAAGAVTVTPAVIAAVGAAASAAAAEASIAGSVAAVAGAVAEAAGMTATAKRAAAKAGAGSRSTRIQSTHGRALRPVVARVGAHVSRLFISYTRRGGP